MFGFFLYSGSGRGFENRQKVTENAQLYGWNETDSGPAWRESDIVKPHDRCLKAFFSSLFLHKNDYAHVGR